MYGKQPGQPLLQGTPPALPLVLRFLQSPPPPHQQGLEAPQTIGGLDFEVGGQPLPPWQYSST